VDETIPPRSPGAEVVPLGAYIRISDDDKDENGEFTREGVTRQETDCRGLSDAIGGTVVKVYDDNNITAADPRVTRPAFEQMLKDLGSGVIQGFVFYHADRVARRPKDASRVCDLFEMNPRLIGRAVQGGTDLSTDEGRAMFVVQAVMGGMEVASTRRRMKRRNKDAAAAGKIHGGKRPFGWEADRKTLRQWEADLLAKAIREIPRGKTIGMIRKEWLAAGVTPTGGGKGALRDQTVLVKVTNPRVCGYRVYRDADDRRETKTLWVPDTLLLIDGEPVIGDWQPIVTPEEWKACVATLEARRTGQINPYTRLHAKYLLSGIARCGECGARMYARVDPGGKRYAYRCLTREGGCGSIRRNGEPVEKHVEDLFLEATRRSLGVVEHDVIDDTIYDSRIEHLREEIKDVMARRKPDHPKRITTAVAMDLVSELEAEIADLTYKARTLTAAKIRRQQDAPSLLREWKSYTIDMKRDRLRRDISAVVINRSGKGYRFNPDLIEIVWAS
jgi:site-specific DNA recombinase